MTVSIPLGITVREKDLGVYFDFSEHISTAMKKANNMCYEEN